MQNDQSSVTVKDENYEIREYNYDPQEMKWERGTLFK